MGMGVVEDVDVEIVVPEDSFPCGVVVELVVVLIFSLFGRLVEEIEEIVVPCGSGTVLNPVEVIGASVVVGREMSIFNPEESCRSVQQRNIKVPLNFDSIFRKVLEDDHQLNGDLS